MPKGVPSKGFRLTKNKKIQMGLVSSASIEPVQPESRFTINERFGFVSDMISMLSSGEQASVIVTGPGGLGKSYNVIKALEKSGMQDVTLLEEFEIGRRMNMAKTFRIIKGYSTPKGLYRTIFENKDGVIVFDDTDSILRDPVSLNILKAALDSYSKRIITWNADIRDEDLPNSFEFKGRIIFISNLSSIQMDQALISRSMTVDLTMTRQQKIDRMRYLIQQSDFMEEFKQEHKNDAMDLIDSLKDVIKENAFSLRSLIQATKIRASDSSNWKNLAEYVLCN